VGRKISDLQKHNLLRNCWQPEKQYKFSAVIQGKAKRHFGRAT